MASGTVQETYSEVLARLAGSQKSMHKAPGYSRWVNRPVGRRLAAAAYLRGLTPNGVTGLSALCTFTALAVVALVEPSVPMALAVSLGLLLGYGLDSADGQLARLRGGGHPLGEWLDHVTDSVKNASVHLVVAISWYRFWQPADDRWLLLPLAFAVVSMTFFFALTLTHQLRRIHGRTVAEDVPAARAGRAAVVPSLATLPNDYGVLCLVFALLAAPGVFAGAYAVLFVANLAFLTVGLAKWGRELRGYDRASWG